MIKNQIVPKQNEKPNEQKKVGFSVTINKPNYQRAIIGTLQDKNSAKRFTTSMVSAVTANPELQECEPMSLISAGLLGESLNLSPSPQLGHFYFVPFNQKEKRDKNGKIIAPACVKASFILGYKGYIQLATRSGQYRKIIVLPIKKGELISFNPLDEEIIAEIIEDENERENTPTIGYYAMFEYINGFRKAMYWSKEKMLAYADKYSVSFSLKGTYSKVSYADYESSNYNKKDEWKYSSFWYKDFDGMACKTMLRQLIGKWGIMSIEMQKAYESDMGVISESGNVEYIDSPVVSDTTEQAENFAEHPEKFDNVQPQSLPEQSETTPPETQSTGSDDQFSAVLEGFEE